MMTNIQMLTSAAMPDGSPVAAVIQLLILLALLVIVIGVPTIVVLLVRRPKA